MKKKRAKEQRGKERVKDGKKKRLECMKRINGKREILTVNLSISLTLITVRIYY